MNEENINIREIFLSLKERYKLILAITISFTIISMLLSFFVIKPKYEASVKLFIGKQESKKTDYDNNDVQMYQKLLTTYAEVIKTDDIIESSMKKIHMDENIKGVEKNLKVTPRADTQILEVSYTDTDKLEAADFLNSLTSNFMKESKKLIPNGNIQIIQKVKTPEKAVSPNKTLNILIAFILGLIVGVGVALLLEFLDNTFKSKDELEKALDLPVLATIPDVEGIGEVDRRERRGRR
ncbi:YveK family protein [Clostridium baratii]|uniref:YveK family protein n=1 Tax=Clostridium baratii TaxID=1561 RepID=UPI0005F2BD3E|nr:Wzz/FepE/Etk N-terminal domain-containing protein [Clostridium baratii]AQM60333.1 capsular biosynthesis protein [Clostridium baratii]KJU72103.1 capsular biosynthesis protein [Clostridium baratii]